MADPKDDRPQADKFRELAHDLECDEDERAFEETVKRVASGHARTPPKPDDSGQ